MAAFNHTVLRVHRAILLEKIGVHVCLGIFSWFDLHSIYPLKQVPVFLMVTSHSVASCCAIDTHYILLV